MRTIHIDINKSKNLNKRVDIDEICLDGVTVDDLKFRGDNYKQYIHLHSLLENVSSCQVSDAFNSISRRSGVIQEIKPVSVEKEKSIVDEAIDIFGSENVELKES